MTGYIFEKYIPCQNDQSWLFWKSNIVTLQ